MNMINGVEFIPVMVQFRCRHKHPNIDFGPSQVAHVLTTNEDKLLTVCGCSSHGPNFTSPTSSEVVVSLLRLTSQSVSKCIR